MLRQVITRRTSVAGDDDGDTLIEVILAVAIVAVTAVALIGSVLTSITSSGEHRTLTLNDTYLKTYADSAAQQIQRQNGPLFQKCAPSYNIATPSTIPSTYTIGISSIQYWNGTAWVASCPGGDPAQLITVAVTSPTQITTSLAFAVRDPNDLGT
jgi:type II secretory pathway pseudopilin PulG